MKAPRIPSRLQARAAPLVERGERFLREFEWTWSKAFVAAVILWFVGLLFLAFIPSWWLFLADQKLHWRQCPCPTGLKFWEFKARDLVAVTLFGVPFAAMVVIPYFLQKVRQRLRSERGERRTGETAGYR